MIWRIGFNLLLTIAIFISSLTLLLSIYPGIMNGLAMFMGIALLWLLLIGGIGIAAIALWLRRADSSMKWGCRRLTTILLILAISSCLLKFYVPLRIGFFFSHSAFEGWLAAHPSSTSKPQLIDTKFGIYQVDEYFSGSRGDKYFRVYSHGDGLSPDTISYGFSYQPNPEGSPFGAAGYNIYQLGDGWYWFKTSNDW